ncbi:uncharacterized protein [Marmota flaviventris]|uniref:uncharacterized protein n=1 Tax=Marmota flaviventris TaxID=93162 RepID=UPI003A856022
MEAVAASTPSPLKDTRSLSSAHSPPSPPASSGAHGAPRALHVSSQPLAGLCVSMGPWTLGLCLCHCSPQVACCPPGGPRLEAPCLQEATAAPTTPHLSISSGRRMKTLSFILPKRPAPGVVHVSRALEKDPAAGLDAGKTTTGPNTTAALASHVCLVIDVALVGWLIGVDLNRSVVDFAGRGAVDFLRGSRDPCPSPAACQAPASAGLLGKAAVAAAGHQVRGHCFKGQAEAHPSQFGPHSNLARTQILSAPVFCSCL